MEAYRLRDRLLRLFQNPVSSLFRHARGDGEKTLHPLEEGTRYPEYPWDLRTLILIFASDSSFYYLNLNVTFGLTGSFLDRKEQLKGLCKKDAFDLQFCLEEKESCVTHKKYYSIEKDVKYKQKAVSFKLGERLSFQGRWPDYDIQYRQPEDSLFLSMRFQSEEGVHWWASFPAMYFHYTSFGHCELKWRWNEKQGTENVFALHDHGWGRNLLPFRTPLSVFRYEVFFFTGEAGDINTAISLWTEGPFGVKLKRDGILRTGSGEKLCLENIDCRVLEWEEWNNYAGGAYRLPRRWKGKLSGKKGEMTYEAVRKTEPRAVIGEGFLYGFDYEGNWKSSSSQTKKVCGRGYAEHAGHFSP